MYSFREMRISLREMRARGAQWAWHWLARALPARLRYWCVIVEGADTSIENPEQEVPAMPFDMLLRSSGARAAL